MTPGSCHQTCIADCLVVITGTVCHTMSLRHLQMNTYTRKNSFSPIQTWPFWIPVYINVICVSLVSCNRSLGVRLDSLFGFVQKIRKVQILWFLRMHTSLAPFLSSVLSEPIRVFLCLLRLHPSSSTLPLSPLLQDLHLLTWAPISLQLCPDSWASHIGAILTWPTHLST